MSAEPYEVHKLPSVDIDDPTIRPVLEDMITATCGFAYPGASQRVIFDAIRWLRAHPQAAAVLGVGQPEDPAVVEVNEKLGGI